MKTLLLIALFVLPTFAQTAHYDKFTDKTTVSIGHTRVGPLMVSPYAVHKGEKATEIYYFLVFARGGRDWQFLRNREAIFLVDGERMVLNAVGRDSKVISVGVTETLTYSFTREDFEKIANASSVEARIGGIEAKFGEKDQKGMKDILTYK